MRKLLLVLWLLLPVAALAYHYGPGQERLKFDDVSRHVRKAENHVLQEEWAEAEKAYLAALELLPSHATATNRRLRLELAKVQMMVKKLPVAHSALKSLVDELENESSTDPVLLAESREALANSQYYMTWLMRLEGHAKDVWLPEIEAARQSYRLLAEQAEENGDEASAMKHREDLESAIRLARMDLSELQGLPLPSQ